MPNDNPNNIKEGDIILREVIFSEVEAPRVVDLFLMKSNYGGVILRAEPGECYFIVDDRPWVITTKARRGLICFCYFPLPDDTSKVIGFKVKRINKSGTSVCVEPVFGTREKLLRHYRVPIGFKL